MVSRFHLGRPRASRKSGAALILTNNLVSKSVPAPRRGIRDTGEHTVRAGMLAAAVRG